MGCFRHCTPEDLEQILAALNTKVAIGSDSKMVDRMLRGEKIDLTRPGAWGRFADRSLKDAFSHAFSTDAHPERITKGFPHRGEPGFPDTVWEHFVLDYKTTNFDSPSYASDAALHRTLNQFAGQVKGYVNSPDLSEAECGVVFFEFPPASQERQEQIDAYLGERGIGVVWGPRW